MGKDPLIYLFPHLGQLAVSNLEVKLQIVGLTFAVSAIIFFLSYLGSYRFVTFKSYLSTKEKVFWCMAFVRAVFGIVASFFGFWYLAVDNTLHKDVVRATCTSSHFAVCMCVGFFLFECTALFSSNVIFRNFDPFLATHHSVSLIGFSISAYSGMGHFFSVVALLLEMTTPFSCICWVLLKAKMAHLVIWKVNQNILVHLFHCRTTIEGYFLYKTYSDWGNISENLPVGLIFVLIGGVSMNFFILTPYWTYKKMMQLSKPVDWNHPELERRQTLASSERNGCGQVHSGKQD